MYDLLTEEELNALFDPPQTAEAHDPPRRFERYACDLPARLVVAGRTLEVRARDIGFGGVAVLLNGRVGLAPDAEAEVRLTLPGDGEVHAQGHVCWLRGLRGSYREAGIRFDALSPEDLHVLMTWFRRAGAG